MIEVILHRILLERDAPVDTDATKTKKELDRLGLVTSKTIQEELDKQEARENASMDKGTVIAIGSTAFNDYGIECPVKVGDYISFAKFGGKEVIDPETEKKYVVINDEDVVAILHKEPKVG